VRRIGSLQADTYYQSLVEALQAGKSRTKVISRFPKEETVLRLVYVTLIIALRSWQGIRTIPEIQE
jgi:hypothetical protein